MNLDAVPGKLGILFGVVTGLLLDTGSPEDELREMLETVLRVRRDGLDQDPRLKASLEVIADVAREQAGE
jgi:hypothetical protein